MFLVSQDKYLAFQLQSVPLCTPVQLLMMSINPLTPELKTAAHHLWMLTGVRVKQNSQEL